MISDFKVGDVVVIDNGLDDIGEITYIDEENGSADVEVEQYDYVTSYSYPLSKLRHVRDLGKKIPIEKKGEKTT